MVEGACSVFAQRAEVGGVLAILGGGGGGDEGVGAGEEGVEGLEEA